MQITDVEAIVLRQATVDDGIADGSQDDLVVLVHTDEGITGIGEVDSAPDVVAALIRQDSSHAVAHSLRSTLVGRDPLDVEGAWDAMYRGLIYVGRRGIAIHAISGIDIALWDIRGKALGKPVCELLGDVQRRPRARVRVDADARHDRGDRASASPRSASRDSRPSSSAGARSGRTPTHDVRLAAAAKDAAGRRGRHPDRRRPRVRGGREDRDRGRARARAARDRLARGAVRPGRVRGVRGARRRGRPDDRRGRAGRHALGVPRADRARPRRPRPARRDPLRRDHRDAADREPRRASTASRRCRTRGRAASSRRRRST